MPATSRIKPTLTFSNSKSSSLAKRSRADLHNIDWYNSRAGYMDTISSDTVDLSKIDLGDYHCGKPFWIRALWFFMGFPIVRSTLLPFSHPRVWLLKLFGAEMGHGILVRTGVRVKNPWALHLGDYCQIGEDVWIDNLAPVTVGASACISQGAYLCTGNHNWSSPSFRYRLGEIHIGDGAWIGAHSVVGPGVTIGKCGVLTLGSVAVKDIRPYEIHGGNPAVFLKQRLFQPEAPSRGVPHRPIVRW